MHRIEQEYDINLPRHNIPLLAPYLFITHDHFISK